MNYLAFDIECSRVYPAYAEMCEFGYVLADENFNILEKKNILIKPKGFDKKLAEKMGFDPERYKNSPKFLDVHGEIFDVLTKADQILLAHSAIDDLHYIFIECERNGLPCPEIVVYDTIKIYESYTGESKSGLEQTKSFTGIEFDAHVAVEDAYAALCILKKIHSSMESAEYNELLESFKKYTVKIADAEDRYYLELAKSELQKKMGSKYAVKEIKSNLLEGLIFSFTKSMISKEPGHVCLLIDIILENSGKITNSQEESDLRITNLVAGSRSTIVRQPSDKGPITIASDEVNDVIKTPSIIKAIRQEVAQRMLFQTE